MIKKLMLAVAALVATMGVAFAQVDVNKADAAALDGVKGIGPAMSKTILSERSKGEFKDWADFEKRVKGVGDKRAAQLSKAGLQVNGQAFAGAAAAAKGADAAAKGADAAAKGADAAAKGANAAAKDANAAKADAKAAKADAKDAKADAKDAKKDAKAAAKAAKTADKAAQPAG